MAIYTEVESAFIAALIAERKAEKLLEEAQKKMSTDNTTNGQLVAAKTADLTNAKKVLQDLLK